jgi:NAD(P)H-quinone oxidoreductase subunit 5
MRQSQGSNDTNEWYANGGCAIIVICIEIAFGMLFLAGFFIMKLGIYRNYPWLYAKLLNISQPYKKTVLMYKSKSLW